MRAPSQDPKNILSKGLADIMEVFCYYLFAYKHYLTSKTNPVYHGKKICQILSDLTEIKNKFLEIL